MSRVERLEASGNEEKPRQQPRETRPSLRKGTRTPDQAEGDESTVDEALTNQDRKRREPPQTE